VLDLGCGSGIPISQTLADLRLHVHGVDASPKMCAAFAARFPDAPIECAPAEVATFLNREYDAVIAWGLLFLLAPETQERVLGRVGAALAPGGTFLFTAPAPACEWIDVLTERKSISLGAHAYRRLLTDAGLLLESETDDEGQNHYYQARKPRSPRR
jgi:SAM-dependent methyltransferase